MVCFQFMIGGAMKEMKKFSWRLFVLIFLSNTRICNTQNINGLQGCECNIANVCDAQGNPRPDWAEFLPQGVGQFGYAIPTQILAYSCEGNAVAILFDGNSKIPLYSATMITGQQLRGPSGGRPTISFRPSRNIPGEYQQKSKDYNQSSKRKICFQKRDKTKEADSRWVAAKKASAQKKQKAGKMTAKTKRLKNDCSAPFDLQEPVHKGHLVASNYCRGDKTRMIATFTFTNVVPQFGNFNSGPWKDCEKDLVEWGERECAFQGTQNVQMFIVVGAIPSTAYGASEARWFGEKGFSNYKLENEFPVNVPKRLWTAACCVYEYYDEAKQLIRRAKNTAFERENDPGSSGCNRQTITSLNALLRNINIFPNTPECNSGENYSPL